MTNPAIRNIIYGKFHPGEHMKNRGYLNRARDIVERKEMTLSMMEYNTTENPAGGRNRREVRESSSPFTNTVLEEALNRAATCLKNKISA